MENILEIKNLNLFYNYGKKQALFSITIDIPEKNVIAIIGPSGCGKSSFLRSINRMNDLIEGTEITGKMLFEGANIYGKTKKTSPKEKGKLKTLERELLKNKIDVKKFKKITIKQNYQSKEIKTYINEEIKKINFDTNKEKQSLVKTHDTVMKNLREKWKKEIRKNPFIFLGTYMPYYLNTLEKFKFIDSNKSLNLIELKKEIKNEKIKYKHKLKEIKNHDKRKKMQIYNYRQECIDNEVNNYIKAHFQTNTEKYEQLYSKYIKQYRKVKGWKPNEVRTRIGLVFQKPNPFAKSIFENIAFGLRAHGITDPWIVYNAVAKALKDAALWDEVKDRLTESALSLSGGQQQRLCIARAISLKPKILLMDEPSASLDPIATKKIEELIRELRKKYTIIIVTHSMQQAARISDYTAFFYEGKLIEYGNSHDIFRNPKFEKTKQYITGDFG